MKLQLQGAAFARPRTLALRDDEGHELTRLTIGSDLKTYQTQSFNLPPGPHWLNLVSLDGTDSPASLAPKDKPSEDKRALSVLVYKLKVV